MELNEIRKSAFNLTQSKYVPNNTVHSECSSIYMAPTGNAKEAMNLHKDAKRVLTVSGIGGFGFEAMLNGAEIVDYFDINELQILFSKMVLVTINKLSYEDFIKHLTIPQKLERFKKQDLKDLLSNEWFSKIKSNLPDDVLYVFDPLYDYFDSVDIILSKLCRFEYYIHLPFLKQFNSYYNEEEYYKLQQILREKKCTINYISSSLEDLPKKINNKYDLICLGNILQYHKDIKSLERPYDVNLFIHNKLSKLLDEEGLILANYVFGFGTIAFQKYFSLPYNKVEDPIKNANRDFGAMLESKNSINISLYEKNEHYTYDIIDGVEIDDGYNNNNMVLTYHQNLISRNKQK